MEHLRRLNAKISSKRRKLNSWFNRQTENVLIPLYTSVDVRVSNNKIVPVDTNVFPAGFNNLSELFKSRASKLFKDYFKRKYPRAENILIVPELHTRNFHYWENILVLRSILENIGYKVDVGIVSDEFNRDQMSFKASNGKEIGVHKVMKKGHKVFTSNIKPDLLLINNDFSERCPKILRDIVQPVEPPVEIGWHTRKKSLHFEFYNKLASKVAEMIGIDPWTITIETTSLKGINFDVREDREKVAAVADSVLDRMRDDYGARRIDHEPYLFVKSDSGTYGMAVMNVSSGDEIRTLNSDKRKRMRINKGGNPVRNIVIQEGVPTALRLESDITAEPVFYLVEAKVAGGFLRLNEGKNEFENLNTRGMKFAQMCCLDDHPAKADEKLLCGPTYELVSCIASLAAGYEIDKILKEGGCKEEVA